MRSRHAAFSVAERGVVLRKHAGRRIPLTVVGGFVGAGKTSVVHRLVAERAGERVAVIFNHLEELVVDGQRRRGTRAALERRISKIITITDGCVTRGATALRLVSEMRRLSEDLDIDSVILELSGIADPNAIASAFSQPCEGGASLSEVATLQAIITTVDAQAFFDDYARKAELEAPGADDSQRSGIVDPAHRRFVACLLADQVESADVLVLTRADRVSGGELALLEATVQHMNPGARIAEYPHRDIQVAEPPAPVASLPAPPSAEPRHGISSFVYHARRPFHPTRLRAWLQSEWPGVLRSRGVFWLASRMNEVGSWSQAGPIWQIARAGYWWATMPREMWSGVPDLCAAIEERWQEPFGDRRQELSFIGFDLDERHLRANFDACLLSDAELSGGPESWAGLRDPFASWSDVIHRGPGAFGPRLLH